MAPMDLKTKLIDRLKKTLPPRILLGKFCFPDGRQGIYADPNYISFFYYLGSELKPKCMAEFDCEIGIRAACCALGSKDTKISLFLEGVSRFADANVRLAGVKPNVYVGKLTERTLELIEESWNLVIVRNVEFLNVIWNKVPHGGVVCMVGKDQAFHDFCKSKNREPIVFQVRDGVILIER